MKIKNPDIRFLYDLKEVLYDQKWLKSAKNFPVYYMYRGIKPHMKSFDFLQGKKKGDLRYDITVILPKMLGIEFPKTKGHEHNKKYGEIYYVLEGRAIYLLQKFKKNQIEDVYAVKAKKGEFVIVPPLYGHITINPAKKELIEANWVSENCQNIYTLFEKNHGACYYYTKSGWIKNKNYKKVPKLRFEKPLKEMPLNFRFLFGKK